MTYLLAFIDHIRSLSKQARARDRELSPLSPP